MLFEDFAKKKFADYASLIQPAGGNIYLKQVRNSSLPPFIINFFEHSYPVQHNLLTEAEFENTLNRAVIFNINYVIKPKNTLLKFLFGEVETRPSDYIRNRLEYFLFYNYYIDHIENFINLNSPVTVSVNQVEHLINVVNKQILAEVSNPSNGDSQRLNLVKLLYIYFLDLAENNPINIKLPKKILSAFFKDKGFTQIQNRVDKFFSEEIFIQETIELMKPVQRKAKVKASFSIIDFSETLFFSDKSFESFNIGLLNVLGKITAAAVTGPAKQPLPASSVPHSKIKLEKFILSPKFKFFDKKILT